MVDFGGGGSAFSASASEDDGVESVETIFDLPDLTILGGGGGERKPTRK